MKMTDLAGNDELTHGETLLDPPTMVAVAESLLKVAKEPEFTSAHSPDFIEGWSRAGDAIGTFGLLAVMGIDPSSLIN